MAKWILALVLLSCYVNTINGLFEHEAGRNDWAIKTLGGEILDAQQMHGWNDADRQTSRDLNQGLLFTLSHKVLAASNMLTGNIVWRKEMDTNNGPTQLRTFRGYVMVFNSHDIQVFSATKGDLVLAINEEQIIKDAQVFVPKLGDSQTSNDDSTATVVAALENGSAAVYKNAKKQADIEHEFVAIGVNSNGVHGLKQSGGKFSVFSINPKTGDADKIESGLSVSTKGSVSYLSNSNGFYVISSSSDSVSSVSKISYSGSVGTLKQSSDIKISEIQVNEITLTHSLGKSGNLESKYTFSASDDTLEIYKDGSKKSQIDSISYTTSGDVKSVFELNNSHFLVQMADYSLHLIDDKLTQKWGRHEGIANIERFKFIDINEETMAKAEAVHYMQQIESMGDSVFNIPTKILARYLRHIAQLKSLILGEKGAHSHPEELQRDEFGFKKILLGFTHDTLLAIQSNTGELIWDLHLSKLIRDSKVLKGSGDHTDVSDFHLIEHEDEDDEVIVVLSTKFGNSLYLIIDPYTGTVKDTQVIMGKKITHSFQIHVGSLRDVVLLVDSDRQVSVYPKTDVQEVNFILPGNRGSDGAYELNGYLYDGKDCNTQGCLTHTWTIPFEGQKLVANSASNVHAQRVTNLNGAVLLKYLDPSLFAVAMASENNSNELYIYLIEGTTGRIVHHAIERNVLINKPINLMLDENSLIISFQRMGKLGEGVQQFQSISFYQQEIKYHARDVIVDYITGKNSTQLYGEMPIVVQNAYVFQYQVKHVGVTKTVQGITGKDLLLVLENDQVYALKKFDTDTAKYLRKLSKMARQRHENQQKEAFDNAIDESLDLDMEDDELLDEQGNPQMIDSFLPFNPQQIITHKHELIGLERVETSPSRLESTSLTLTYGVDLFYTTIAPEKQFDILNEDFRKDYLILTIIGLVIGSKIMSWYFTKKKLTAKMHQD